MLDCGQVVSQMEVEAWATPQEGMSIWGLARRMNELGNPVLEVCEDTNRIKILHKIDE